MEDYFKSLKNALIARNHSEVERLMGPANVPPLSANHLGERADADRQLSDDQKNICWIANGVGRTKQSAPREQLSLYRDVLERVQQSRIMEEEHEFDAFFRQLFAKLRTDLKRGGLVSQENLAAIISTVRQIFVAQRKADFKRVLPIALHQLLYLHFATNQYQQCAVMFSTMVSIIDSILAEAQRLESLNINFYLSRLDHFKNDFESAEAKLETVFRQAFNNRQRRRALELLIPVKLNRGVYPSKSLCRAFKLGELEQLTTCVKTGDLAAFDAVVQRNTLKWVKSGALFMLNQCKQVLLANLIHRIYKHLGSPAKIDLALVEAAMNINRPVKFSKSEVAVVVSGLVYSKRVNGKVFMESHVLHLNQSKDPFR